jgi:hypothetical protein
MNTLGLALIGLFAAAWIVSAVIWRVRRPAVAPAG